MGKTAMRVQVWGRGLCLAATLLLAGCGGVGSARRGVEQVASSAGFQGRVYGGQQPVQGATIQLYTVGTSGDGSAATPLLTQTVTTDCGGNFNITGLYSCSNATEIYMVAMGGNPGVGSNNPQLALMAALGPCENLTPSTYIVVNELTTVAAVYSLAPFMQSATMVGSGTGDAAALTSGFALANELVNTATGTSPGTNVPSGVVVPTGQLNLLANILAACVNTAGGIAGDGSGCGTVLSLTTPGNMAPTNTIAAALNLANNPTLNTTALFNLAQATGPFQPMPIDSPQNMGVTFTSPTTLYVTPATVNFGIWPTGRTSTAQVVDVTNYGSAPVSMAATISGSAPGSFYITDDSCGATIAPQGSCSYAISFSPTALGNLDSFLVLSNSSPDSLVEVPLSGVGQASVGPVTLSQSSLNFSVAGTTQDVLVENFGNTPISISGVSFSNFGSSSNSDYPGSSADFSQTNNCGTSLAAQSACTISVSANVAVFEFSGAVTFTATMTVLDNASGGPQTLPVSSTNTADVTNELNLTTSGVGVPATALLSLSTGSRYFSANATYAISGVDAGDFSVSPDTCSYYQEPAPPCTVTVTFTPTTSGVRSAQVLVDGTNQYIPLTGTIPPGPASGPAFTVSPSPFSVNFTLSGSSDPFNAKGVGTLTITNGGSTTLNYVGSLSGANASNFTADGSSCALLAPGKSCGVTISLTGANVAGVYLANLLIEDANSTWSRSLPITGIASYWTPLPSIAALQFGTEALGTTSAAIPFSVADPDGYPLGHPVNITLPSPSNFTLTQGSSCPASLTQSCTLAAAFSPYQTGFIRETATITDLTSGYTSALYLTGTGGSPAVSLSTNILSFPARATGTTSVPMMVTVTNTGTLALTVTSVNLIGAVNNNFTESNNCGTVAPNSMCSINVMFAPTVTGMQAASIQIISNASSSPDTVGINGTGQ